MPMGATSNLNLKVVMAWAAETDDQQFNHIDNAAGTIQDISGYWGTVYEAIYSTDLTDGVGDVGQHFVTEEGHPDYVEPEEEE